MTITPAKPFLRWVGGKRSLLPVLLPLIPDRGLWDNYREPFVSGGAMFYALQPQVALLSDSNEELIHLYKVIRSKTQCRDFLNYLEHHQEKHSFDHYMQSRKDLNQIITGQWKANPIYRATLFYYLNKICFNGLWRVNSKGEFNVPMDRSKKKLEVNKQNILACSRLLRESAALEACSFKDFFGKNGHIIGRREFWFLDPPYDGKHNDYVVEGFTGQDQEKLLLLCYKIHRASSYFMLTSSDTPFIRKLYQKDFKIIKANVQHSVAAAGNKRTIDKEIIIMNY